MMLRGPTRAWVCDATYLTLNASFITCAYRKVRPRVPGRLASGAPAHCRTVSPPVLQTLLPPVRSATHVGMPALAAAVRAVFCQGADLVLENLARRQQLAILARRRPRPRLSALDRVFWAGLAKPARAPRRAPTAGTDLPSSLADAPAT